MFRQSNFVGNRERGPQNLDIYVEQDYGAQYVHLLQEGHERDFSIIFFRNFIFHPYSNLKFLMM